MLKNILIFAIFTLVGAISSQAALIIRDTVSNKEVVAKELASFSTSDNPVITLLLEDGENFNLEITEASLQGIAVSKIDLLKTINEGLKDKSHDYRIITRQNTESAHRQDIMGIFISRPTKR